MKTLALMLAACVAVPANAQIAGQHRKVFPAGGGGVAIQFATGKTCSAAVGSVTSVSCSASMVLAAGTLVVVACDGSRNTGVTYGASDDAANTYTSLSSLVSNSTTISVQLFGFYYAGAQTRTPKCTYTGANSGGFADINAAGYLNVASTSFQDGSAVSGTGTGASATTTSFTPSQCGDALVMYAASSSGGTVTNGTGFTVRIAPSGNGNGMGDDILTDSSSHSGSLTVPSGTWAAALAAIKAGSHC